MNLAATPSGFHGYTHTNGQQDWVVARPDPGVLWVELRVGLAQEAGLQRVPAAPVDQETALVQVHGLAQCLEVQSHCKGRKNAQYG